VRELRLLARSSPGRGHPHQGTDMAVRDTAPLRRHGQSRRATPRATTAGALVVNVALRSRAFSCNTFDGYDRSRWTSSAGTTVITVLSIGSFRR
jgi:hypothetical protein